MNFRIIVEGLITKILIHKLASALLFLSPILTGAFLAGRSYLMRFFADPSGQIAFLSLTLTIAVVPLPFAAFFYFKPRLIFDDKLGVFRDIKTGALYCPSCKVKKIQAPLTKRDGYWRCVSKDCGTTYDNPNHIAPQVKVENKSKRGNYG